MLQLPSLVRSCLYLEAQKTKYPKYMINEGGYSGRSSESSKHIWSKHGPNDDFFNYFLWEFKACNVFPPYLREFVHNFIFNEFHHLIILRNGRIILLDQGFCTFHLLRIPCLFILPCFCLLTLCYSTINNISLVLNAYHMIHY
jgi:hypothetical protein